MSGITPMSPAQQCGAHTIVARQHSLDSPPSRQVAGSPLNSLHHVSHSSAFVPAVAGSRQTRCASPRRSPSPTGMPPAKCPRLSPSMTSPGHSPVSGTSPVSTHPSPPCHQTPVQPQSHKLSFSVDFLLSDRRERTTSSGTSSPGVVSSPSPAPAAPHLYHQSQDQLTDLSSAEDESDSELDRTPDRDHHHKASLSPGFSVDGLLSRCRGSPEGRGEGMMPALPPHQAAAMATSPYGHPAPHPGLLVDPAEAAKWASESNPYFPFLSSTMLGGEPNSKSFIYRLYRPPGKQSVVCGIYNTLAARWWKLEEILAKPFKHESRLKLFIFLLPFTRQLIHL